MRRRSPTSPAAMGTRPVRPSAPKNRSGSGQPHGMGNSTFRGDGRREQRLAGRPRPNGIRRSDHVIGHADLEQLLLEPQLAASVEGAQLPVERPVRGPRPWHRHSRCEKRESKRSYRTNHRASLRKGPGGGGGGLMALPCSHPRYRRASAAETSSARRTALTAPGASCLKAGNATAPRSLRPIRRCIVALRHCGYTRCWSKVKTRAEKKRAATGPGRGKSNRRRHLRLEKKTLEEPSQHRDKVCATRAGPARHRSCLGGLRPTSHKPSGTRFVASDRAPAPSAQPSETPVAATPRTAGQ